ncbi:dTDP-glucose 4,6-dehydratase [Gammaproteobacteria bacterium]|nr:dTDP-glucose 4,6-dehydratase [Gammaproteobacteria bacterium]
MRVLVTGGLGFIGSALIRTLIDETDYEVLNIDKCTYAAMPEAIEGKEQSKNYNFQQIDIANYKETYQAIKTFNPNKIYHLAAESHVDNSIKNPSSFIETNIIGTFNILQSIKELKQDLPEEFMIIHVSTDEVFGSLSFEDKPFTEDSPYLPNSPYSSSKASSDLLVRSWHETYGIKAVITNCSNNYGPWQNPEKLIPKIIFNALEGDVIPIYGSGENIRDWLHVSDHVNALLSVGKTNEIFSRYVIGGNQEMSNINLAKIICDYLDKAAPSNSKYFNQVEYVNDRLGHDLRYAIDASRISRNLGFKPAYNLQEGIESTIDWYLQNKSWVKRKVSSNKQ